MTKLSVNINKVALLRNARTGNYPDLFTFAKKCEDYGADGITVHPRPDERHIRYSDIPILKQQGSTEFNIEGNPTPAFMKLVLKHKPDQCTLVPDSPDALTSDKGWDTIKEAGFLKEIISQLKENGIRVSVFLDPVERLVEGAANVGADRIEFYTGDYAKQYLDDPDQAIKPHVYAAKESEKIGLGINAGHDLNLDNLFYYKSNIPFLKEVSIGHAIIADTLYYGIQNTVQLYLRELNRT